MPNHTVFLSRISTKQWRQLGITLERKRRRSMLALCFSHTTNFKTLLNLCWSRLIDLNDKESVDIQRNNYFQEIERTLEC